MRNQALDGVRGLAALAVLYMHVVVHMGLLPFAPLGGMGVLMFFVLSGYLIASICWRASPDGSAYRSFLGRRVRRLAPVNLALVGVGGPVLLLWGGLSLQQVLEGSALALTQTTGVALAAGAEVQEAFRPTWSLTVEWLFYLTFPLVLLALRRRGAGPGATVKPLAGLGLVLYLAALPLEFTDFYLLPVANLGLMFAGAALASWHRSGPTVRRSADPARSYFALALLTIFVFMPGYTLSWGYKISVFPAVGVATLVLIHGCWMGNRTARTMSTGWLRAVGLRAYSLYLWHMPVLWLAWVNMPDSSPPVRALVALLCLVPVVELSFRLLEVPVLRGRLNSRPPSGSETLEKAPTVVRSDL